MGAILNKNKSSENKLENANCRSFLRSQNRTRIGNWITVARKRPSRSGDSNGVHLYSRERYCITGGFHKNKRMSKAIQLARRRYKDYLRRRMKPRRMFKSRNFSARNSHPMRRKIMTFPNRRSGRRRNCTGAALRGHRVRRVNRRKPDRHYRTLESRRLPDRKRGVKTDITRMLAPQDNIITRNLDRGVDDVRDDPLSVRALCRSLVKTTPGAPADGRNMSTGHTRPIPNLQRNRVTRRQRRLNRNRRRIANPTRTGYRHRQEPSCIKRARKAFRKLSNRNKKRFRIIRVNTNRNPLFRTQGEISSMAKKVSNRQHRSRSNKTSRASHSHQSHYFQSRQNRFRETNKPRNRYSYHSNRSGSHSSWNRAESRRRGKVDVRPRKERKSRRKR